MRMNKKQLVFLIAVLIIGFSASVFGQSSLPRLVKKGNAGYMAIDQKPMLILGGELHNSSTGSVQQMAQIWGKLREYNLNTVIAPVTWELLEPEEGKFDYTQIDSMIAGCRKNGLKLVVLWFGSWKNGQSVYVPEWVKLNQKRFPLICFKDGTRDRTLSALGKESVKADVRAYSALMRHIKAVDGKAHTVILMQLENEMGTIDIAKSYRKQPNDAMRDYSELGNRAYAQQVPQKLMTYLEHHKKELHPAIANAWKEHGYKTSGTWEEVFGVGAESKASDWKQGYSYLTEEIFNAWNYASYVEQLAKAGKEIYPIPVYVNLWIKQPKTHQPGQYPSGAPQPHVADIWRCAAPDVDFYAPDIYATDIFDWTCQQFRSKGNPLFILETRGGIEGAARAFYTIGRYSAMGYSPFGIDGGFYINNVEAPEELAKVYKLLGHMTPYIVDAIGSNRMTGMYIDNEKTTDKCELGNYTLSMRRLSTASSTAAFGTDSKEQKKPQNDAGGALVIQTDEDEFLVVGGLSQMVVNILPSKQEKNVNVGVLTVDKILFDENGKPYYHRLNGDQTTFGAVCFYKGQADAFRVRMYKY
jgi:hypothetical protein